MGAAGRNRDLFAARPHSQKNSEWQQLDTGLETQVCNGRIWRGTLTRDRKDASQVDLFGLA